MAKYGYLVGGDIDSKKLISPLVLEKIHLTPSRPKFVVVGTKYSIFEWMENYGNIVCELEQDFHSMPHPKQPDRTTINISLNNDPATITFKLYDEKGHKYNILKNLLSPASKMRMEIRAVNHDDQSSSPPTSIPIMEANAYNGVKLYQVLNKWKVRKLNSEQRARDYE